MDQRSAASDGVLQALLAASPLPMLVCAAEGDLRVLALNEKLSELLSHRGEQAELAGAWWSRCFPDPAYRDEVRAAWAAALRKIALPGSAEPIEARVTCRDGSERRLEFNLGLHSGSAFALCNDVTERRRAEAELTEASGFLQRVVDTSPSFIFVVDETGRLVFVNRSVAAYYATTREAMLSKSTEEVHADAGQARSFVQDDIEVIRTGKEIVKEELNTAPDGQVHWFHTVKVPLVRPDGRVQCLGIATDITARKHAEDARSELEAAMWQSQKLESLGVLAGGIAHDFNNLLASIRSNAQLVRARVPADSTARPFLHGIELATRHASQLTDQMLAYVGRGHACLEMLCLGELVSEMKKLLDAVVSKKAEFRLELSPARVEADAAQIHQVVMNLITNASDSLGEQSGRIVIRTGARRYEPAELSSNLVEDIPPAGPYAFLEVEDDGCGMETGMIARIFDPFYSTKFAGRGLGLSAVLGIVRGHRGTIQVDSQVGRGTRFVVLLPHAVLAEQAPESGAQPLPGERRGTLLVIDDEELIRCSVCFLLEDAGFSVLSAADGQAGLELFQRRASEIDGVVLDLTMPRLDGWQCLQRLREIRKDIPVLIMSGYAAEFAIPAGVAAAPPFLRKPFDGEELVQAAARLIAAPA